MVNRDKETVVNKGKKSQGKAAAWLWLFVNPIIIKELRSRMRGPRAFILLTVILAMLGLATYLVYRLALAASSYTNMPLSPQIGLALFMALAFLELMMICFVTPAVTAGAISSEREKLTYEMLLTTPLSPVSILWGKLISALSYVFLLIFAALPLASLVFTFGGVSIRDMVKALLVLLITTVMLGVLGVFLSTALGRTARATVVSYLIVLALLIVPVFAYIAVGVIGGDDRPPRWLLAPSPVGALFSVFSMFNIPYMGSFNLFIDLGRLLGGNLDIVWGEGQGIPRPLYHYTLPLYFFITVVCYWLATRLVRPIHRWRLLWREALLVIIVLVIFGAGVGLAFSRSADRYENAGKSEADVPALVEPARIGLFPTVQFEEKIVPTIEEGGGD